MPLFQKWNCPNQAQIAIWRISEDISFFENALNLNDIPIKHLQRRTEYLAGRYLLKYLQPDIPIEEIIINEQGKPHLQTEHVHFSITHSYPYVACMIQHKHQVGIDLQCWHPNIAPIAQKFISPKELALLPPGSAYLHMAWTAKEAAFKYQGLKGVDFIKNLPICAYQENKGISNIIINNNLISKNAQIKLNSLIFNDFVISWSQ